MYNGKWLVNTLTITYRYWIVSWNIYGLTWYVFRIVACNVIIHFILISIYIIYSFFLQHSIFSLALILIKKMSNHREGKTLKSSLSKCRLRKTPSFFYRYNSSPAYTLKRTIGSVLNFLSFHEHDHTQLNTQFELGCIDWIVN